MPVMRAVFPTSFPGPKCCGMGEGASGVESSPEDPKLRVQSRPPRRKRALGTARPTTRPIIAMAAVLDGTPAPSHLQFSLEVQRTDVPQCNSSRDARAASELVRGGGREGGGGPPLRPNSSSSSDDETRSRCGC